MTAPVLETPDGSAPEESRPGVLAGALDALLVAVWFAVAGVVGAVVWWQVTTLPKITKAGDNATLAPGELVKQVDIDGWFFVIAGVGGLLSGIALLAWRRRDPLLMVILVVLGGALASWLMVRVGLALGPGNELTALRGKADGTQVSMQLKLHAQGMVWIWSMGAALGSLVYVWVLGKPHGHRPG